MKKAKTISLLLLMFLITIVGYSQTIPKDTLKFYCNKPEGASVIKNKLAKNGITNSTFYYQAAALGISENEVLENYIKDLCLGAFDEAPWSNIEPLSVIPTIEDKVVIPVTDLIYCKSKWNGECNYKTEIFVPYGYQVCGLEYDTDGRGDFDEPKFIPIYFLDEGNGSPYKFYGYRIILKSRGSKNILNQVSANIKVKNLKLIAVADRFNPSKLDNILCQRPPLNRNEIFHLIDFKVVKGPIKPFEDEIDSIPPETNQEDRHNDAFTRITYTSKKCSYDIYKTSEPNSCDNWTFAGRVTKNKNISVTIKPGEHFFIRAMKKGFKACKASERKQEDNIFMKKNTTKTSILSYELHDFDCN